MAKKSATKRVARTDREITNSWSLIAFSRENGRMQIGDFVNSNGEPFKSCVFTHPTKKDPEDTSRPLRKFVQFSQNLGVLTPAEISAMKDDLQVVEMDEGEVYSLCKKGDDNWEDVDLGI